MHGASASYSLAFATAPGRVVTSRGLLRERAGRPWRATNPALVEVVIVIAGVISALAAVGAVWFAYQAVTQDTRAQA
jgi:hypothetical protein